MERDGPGFLADLAFFWVMIVLCTTVANVIGRQIGRPLGLLLGIGAAVVIVFFGLLSYYRIFLDERPVLGTRSRSRFAALWIQLFLFGFVLGVMFGPPDVTTQLGITSVSILLSLFVSYWYVYRKGSNSEKQTTTQ